MTSRRGSIHRSSSASSAASAAWYAAAGACLLFAIASAPAQDAQTQIPPSDPPPEAQAPSPNYQPGFIDAVGRWLEQGAAKFKSDMQGAQENLDKLGGQARDAAKDVTGGLLALPGARVVSGRVRCEPAPNGAPDCLAAANSVCQGKGFQSGRSLDTQSEQKCPARLLLQGRAPNDTDCRTEMFVTRAVCQ
jgi:hypothetical protein